MSQTDESAVRGSFQVLPFIPKRSQLHIMLTPSTACAENSPGTAPDVPALA